MNAYNFDEVSFSKNVKGHSTEQKLVSQDADAPNINFVAIVVSLKKFGWNIERSSAKGLSTDSWTDWPSEVTYFDHALNIFEDKYIVKEDVFGLQVPM